LIYAGDKQGGRPHVPGRDGLKSYTGVRDAENGYVVSCRERLHGTVAVARWQGWRVGHVTRE